MARTPCSHPRYSSLRAISSRSGVGVCSYWHCSSSGGGIDYAFEYKSVAEQHGLRYLELPAEIDLRSPEQRVRYEAVRVRLGFQRFTSVGIERVGIPIYYGITVPKNAPNPDLGVAFMHFMLSEEGQNVLREVHHPPSPAEADILENVPDELRDVVVNEIANRRV